MSREAKIAVGVVAALIAVVSLTWTARPSSAAVASNAKAELPRTLVHVKYVAHLFPTGR